MDYTLQTRSDAGMNVAVIGNYVPRRCGLATFTTDVATWVARTLGPESDVFVVAMNDREDGYDYPPMVRFEVLANNPRDYPRAADYVNLSTQQRRSLVRFFACGQDLSLEPADAPLPAAVAAGAEPFLIVGAMAGG